MFSFLGSFAIGLFVGHQQALVMRCDNLPVRLQVCNLEPNDYLSNDEGLRCFKMTFIQSKWESHYCLSTHVIQSHNYPPEIQPSYCGAILFRCEVIRSVGCRILRLKASALPAVWGGTVPLQASPPWVHLKEIWAWSWSIDCKTILVIMVMAERYRGLRETIK